MTYEIDYTVLRETPQVVIAEMLCNIAYELNEMNKLKKKEQKAMLEADQ